MKSITNIQQELEKNNWETSEDIKKSSSTLLPVLSKTLDDGETVYSQIWGSRTVNKEKTNDIQVMTLTNKRIITIYKNVGTRSGKIIVNSQPIRNIRKIKINEIKNEKGVIDFKITFANNEIVTRCEDFDTIKNFEDSLNKMEKTNTKKIESTSIMKKVFKNEKSFILNSNFWFLVAALMSLAILIISAVVFSDNTGKGSIWIPAGVFGVVFAFIGIISTAIQLAICWDKYKFSSLLYSSILNFVFFAFVLIISIIVASQTTMAIMQNFEIAILVISIFSIVDSTYNLAKNYYELTYKVENK